MSELKPCPICGATLKIYSPEDWKPTFYDPDSGGDPYNAVCDCGFSFCNESYDYGKFVAGLNRRAERTGRWVHDINNLYACSECYGRETMSPRKLKIFCPHCGAHMIEGDEHA